MANGFVEFTVGPNYRIDYGYLLDKKLVAGSFGCWKWILIFKLVAIFKKKNLSIISSCVIMHNYLFKEINTRRIKKK